MDWGSIIASAMGGGAQQAGALADDQLAQTSKYDLLREQQKMELEKVKAAAEMQQQMADRNRAAQADRINTAAKGIVAGRMSADNPVADQSTWTPEQEAARNQGIAAQTQKPSVLAAAANQTGYYDTAEKIMSAASKGNHIVGIGQQLRNADGEVLGDNGGDAYRDLITAQKEAQTAATKSNAESRRIEAEARAARAAAGPKGIDPSKKAEDAQKAANSVRLPPAPFVDPEWKAANPGKMAKDEVGEATFGTIFGRIYDDHKGDYGAVVNHARAIYTKLDKQITDKARDTISKIYDPNGKVVLDDKNIAAFTKVWGINPAKAQPWQVGNAIREQSLLATMERMQNGDPEPEAAPTPAPKAVAPTAEPPSQPPKPPPEPERKAAPPVAPARPRGASVTKAEWEAVKAEREGQKPKTKYLPPLDAAYVAGGN